MKDFPDDVMPERADPPYNRDCLLPRPDHELGPEAREWLGANWSASALAGNRFQDTAQALTFVEQLYAAGARHVRVDHVMFLHNHLWTPYADTLIVDLPTDHTVGQSSSSSWKAPASPMSMTGSGHYWIRDRSPSGCGGIETECSSRLLELSEPLTCICLVH